VKGDAARSLRALTAGISRAALACSVLAAAFYAAGNRNGLSDAALGLALDLAAVAAAAAIAFSVFCLAATLAAPGTGRRPAVISALACLAPAAAGALVLAAAQFLRAAFGGLSF